MVYCTCKKVLTFDICGLTKRTWQTKVNINIQYVLKYALAAKL